MEERINQMFINFTNILNVKNIKYIAKNTLWCAGYASYP